MCEREREIEQAEGTGAWLEAVVVVGAVGAQYSTSSLVADGSSPTNQTHQLPVTTRCMTDII